jgi:hypothetical protein
MVPHPDQSDLPNGSLRFILSLRSTGEGHISSITFRTGVLDENGEITIIKPTRYCFEPAHIPNAAYHKPLFERKLQELGLAGSLRPRQQRELIPEHRFGYADPIERRITVREHAMVPDDR